MFESPGLNIPRAVGKYGQSRGWRRNRLRTPHFTLDAIGLDTAARGVKIDEARPDVIIFDDLDDQDDSEKVTLRKERDLTRKILPAASRDVAVLGIQNIPNTNGIFARLVDGRADYLMDRIVSGPFPALTDFDCERAENAEGKPYFRITSGTPTWQGQDLEACQALLNLIGKRSFEVESLHQTDKLKGLIFERQWFEIVGDWPQQARQVRFWDLASTEEKPGSGNDPDWTAGVKVAEWRGQYWIVDVQHFRASPKGVEDRIRQTAQLDGRGVDIWIEQEAGASGKNTIDHYQRTVLLGFTVKGMRSTGSKPERAKPVSSAAEAGNVFLVAGKWNAEYLDELEEFPTGLHDDMVDGTSGAVLVLSTPREAGTWGSR
jgi:predicted phage terminase large subunit-like protein